MKVEEALGLFKAVAELERRIVKLEAYMEAIREEARERARAGMVPDYAPRELLGD